MAESFNLVESCQSTMPNDQLLKMLKKLVRKIESSDNLLYEVNLDIYEKIKEWNERAVEMPLFIMTGIVMLYYFLYQWKNFGFIFCYFYFSFTSILFKMYIIKDYDKT